MKITSETIDKIGIEYAKWADFLNIGVGLFSFSLGISCLSSDKPYISTLALIFVTMFMVYGQKHFPHKINELRKATLALEDKKKLKEIQHKYFGIKSLFTNCPVFLAGYMFLFAVCLFDIYRKGSALH